ncbi:MAG: hypothetical protein ACI9H8_000682 [Lysobacterales bacterium]|jgi:hypothetical protein
MNKKLLLILVVLIAAIATAPYLSAANVVYKWVDKDGAVHFGNLVPDGYEGTRVDVKPNTVNTVSPVEKKLIETDLQDRTNPETASNEPPELSIAEQKRQTRAENRRKYAEEADKRTRECAIMRQQKATVEPSPRVLVNDEKGGVRRLGNEEREDILKEANDFIANNCN